MHLRSRLLFRLTSNLLDNSAHPMANISQAPNLEGIIHREMHGIAEQIRIMNEINARLDLDDQVDAINTDANAPVIVYALIRQTEPLFTYRVMKVRVSSKFKLPSQLGMYKGKTDPMDHLNSYKNLMILQGYLYKEICKAFSITLKGPTRSWFRKLSPRTTDSFSDLSRLFVANFMGCRVRRKNASYLFIVHQKDGESLKDFVKRFNQVVLEVEDPTDKVVVMAMIEGLRPGPLFGSLSKRVPKTLSALQSKADKCIAAEELVEAKRKRGDILLMLPPLNTLIAQVLMEIKNEDFMKWLGKIKTNPLKRNKNKYYEFHKDHGHNTEDYFQLKEQIADLIKRGYLRKFVVDR
ncbi:hypothetical protein Acr_00g0055200 [Actinidia rufa]|uniref:Retrotransposon gag domain-containing protein n=1 Tax=Actinidia rufa TaxID=165716 RepID=A0A7J0DM03_9ERIC|nr:hypothetical protein Acr_00g0055200 [Actinidia rufa]